MVNFSLFQGMNNYFRYWARFCVWSSWHYCPVLPGKRTLYFSWLCPEYCLMILVILVLMLNSSVDEVDVVAILLGPTCSIPLRQSSRTQCFNSTVGVQSAGDLCCCVAWEAVRKVVSIHRSAVMFAILRVYTPGSISPSLFVARGKGTSTFARSVQISGTSFTLDLLKSAMLLWMNTHHFQWLGQTFFVLIQFWTSCVHGPHTYHLLTIWISYVYVLSFEIGFIISDCVSCAPPPQRKRRNRL